MKKLLLWLVMVVVMLAVLLGGAGYAMYAMTGDDKLPTQHPTLGDTELEPIGYDSVSYTHLTLPTNSRV